MQHSQLQQTLFRILLITCALLAPLGASAEATKPATAIDWSKADSQAIDQSCGDITFTHMEDAHSYNLFVRGREATICSFSADGLKFVYPGDHGTTSQGKRTLYSLVRFGSEVLVSWVPGY